MTDPKITGRVTSGLRDFYAASFWSWSARSRWTYAVGFVVVVAYTLWINDAHDLDTLKSSIAIPLLAIVLGVAVWLALIAFIFARVSPQQKKVEYEIDHERILVRDASGTTIVRPWAEVTVCQEHKTGFILHIRPMGWHWLAKRAFSPTDLQALRALIAPRRIELIIAADEPALFYDSVASAELDLEAIDVRDGVYGPVYGRHGEAYRIDAVGDRVVIVPDQSKTVDPHGLRQVLTAPCP